MVFHESLSDSKSPQVSKTRLRILAVLSNAVIWIISTRPPTSKSTFQWSFSYCAKSTNPNWHNRPFHVPQLFQFSSKVEVLIILFIFFQIYSVVRRDSKVDNFANSLFLLLIIIRSGLLAGIHHHRIALVARISLTLSRHSSLSFIALGRSSGQHPVSSDSCWMYVRAGRPAFARPCVGVHKNTSLMSSSLLLQQCPACLVRLTWIVFVIGGRWPYSWCLVGCCRQDLFKIAGSILV